MVEIDSSKRDKKLDMLKKAEWLADILERHGFEIRETGVGLKYIKRRGWLEGKIAFISFPGDGIRVDIRRGIDDSTIEELRRVLEKFENESNTNVTMKLS